MYAMYKEVGVLIFFILLIWHLNDVNGTQDAWRRPGGKIKSRDTQTVVKEKVLGSVNADFDDIGVDLDRYFTKNMPFFSQSSVITLSGTAPEKRQAARRALGGRIYFHLLR